MDFRKMFNDVVVAENNTELAINDELELDENTPSSIDKIKKAKLKIKQTLPTRFGKEVIFFKDADAIAAAKLVGTDKIDGKSIFID